jgi:hypothetical protein
MISFLGENVLSFADTYNCTSFLHPFSTSPIGSVEFRWPYSPFDLECPVRVTTHQTPLSDVGNGLADTADG